MTTAKRAFRFKVEAFDAPIERCVFADDCHIPASSGRLRVAMLQGYVLCSGSPRVNEPAAAPFLGFLLTSYAALGSSRQWPLYGPHHFRIENLLN